MSRRGRDQNRDSCRDLSGRRIHTVKRARAIAAAVLDAPTREREEREAKRERLRAAVEAGGRGEQGGLGRAKRMDDGAYVADCERGVEGIRLALTLDLDRTDRTEPVIGAKGAIVAKHVIGWDDDEGDEEDAGDDVAAPMQ